MTEFDKVHSDDLPLIDLDKIIRNSKSRILQKMPRFVIKYFKKLIHQDEVNGQIVKHKDKFGLDFIIPNMEYLNLKTVCHGIENAPSSGRFIFVCNHPLGGIDFFSALVAISPKFPKLKVIANDILMTVENLKDLFLPVNVFGPSPQEYHDLIDEALASENQLMTFPAGEVSRKRKGVIMDCVWHKSFVRNAIEYKRDIVPIYIHARNSKRFYRLGCLRERLGIKLNFELLLLPDEFFRQRNKTIRVIVGEPISYQLFNDSKEHHDWAQEVKRKVYRLQKTLSPEILKTY